LITLCRTGGPPPAPPAYRFPSLRSASPGDHPRNPQGIPLSLITEYFWVYVSGMFRDHGRRGGCGWLLPSSGRDADQHLPARRDLEAAHVSLQD
jgi:hypothetical protein